MNHARSPWLVALALSSGCATASLTPPRPRVGMGVIDVAATPQADAVTLVRQQPPLGVDEAPATATETPARFEVKPGRYRMELWKDGGRYGYDLSVDVQELVRQDMLVELRSSPAVRTEATVFAGLGVASTGALGYICATKKNQACGGAAAVAALTSIVAYYAIQAWRHDGRIVASETTSLGKAAPPPVLRAPPPRPAPAAAPPPPSKPPPEPAVETAPPPAPAPEKAPPSKKKKKPGPPPAS